eukprot:349686-Chlamydomonas_euryale.AAC.1
MHAGAGALHKDNNCSHMPGSATSCNPTQVRPACASNPHSTFACPPPPHPQLRQLSAPHTAGAPALTPHSTHPVPTPQ